MDFLREHVELLAKEYSIFDVLLIAQELAEEEWKVFDCLDCGVRTCDIDSYYMVLDDIWYTANKSGEGMLCFDCLEKRIDRKLTVKDFTNAPLNASHVHKERFAAA